MSHALLIVATPHVKENTLDDLLAPFQEGEEWFAEGTRWDWWSVGGRWRTYFNGFPIMRKSDLDMDEWKKNFIKEIEEQASYSCRPGETIEQYRCRRLEEFPCAFAFLKDREWNEPAQMGWWGTTHEKEAESYPIRETFKCEKGEVTIVTWGDEGYRENYWSRFITPLPDDYLLIAIDYHI